ncbi:D-alanyl-D-alanine carboxypeptidase family protein [Subdoligranulum sp. AM23-21AC]|uniref:M15 family metallopeptidase n=1 Tax=Ruthenibacterium lactatiformans TaxID=1550024 RepID=UPI000E3F4E0F|nr:M15 family metallopeptidase [Ruthenibacterium lactatiformans]RGD17830.1 D-alanyl-D-alanine carboxypeptidase family protein [Subdoligranulum sp. AM23-21AC]RJW24035.1 D-alanyl-D-alanine carboxypeptidase family protein [Subdoligranulum sp. TF05-17AC]
MPTTDFFSGPGFEPEDVPVKKTSPAQQPVEKQPADDEPFAGMQKLDFDFLGGDDPAVPGETDPGDPFDDFSFQRPAAPAGPAQPARPAPFVFDEEPAPAPFSGVPETRITPAASASLGGTDDAPVRPVSPAQAAPKAAPFVFDFDDAPVERPASRTAASAAPSGEAVFDFGIPEEKPAPAPAATPLDGYAPLSLDFLDDAEPIAAVPPAAPAAVKPVEPPRPAQPAPKAAPFVFDFDDAPVERPASRTAASAVPSGEAAFDFGILEEKPARPAPASAAAPLDGYTPLPLDILDDAKPVAAVPPAAPAAVKPAEPPRSAEPVPKAAPFVFDFDDAPVERPASRPGQPGSTASPLYSAADAPTVAFTPAALQADAPTTAFTPVKSDAPAPAAAPQPAPPKMAAQPAPAARAARMAKEKDIGAAVFSALVADDDVPPAPAVPPASGGEELRPSGWPAATPRPANAPRTPRPINWHAPVSPAQRPAPAPARPAPPPAQAPQPPAAETPLDFDFEGAQPFDLFDDVPQSGYTAPQEADPAFPDLYDRDPEEAEPASRAPQRRTRTGGGSGSGGGRPPRRSTGTARRGIPNKTIFAWAGIVLIALLIILYFVFFGGKDGDVAPGTSGSVPSSTSQPADSTPPDASSAAPVETIPRDEWYMVLANRSSVLPGDFTVAETATVGEAVVDARIAEALRQMVNDAAAAGVKLKPTNGYRSIARQQELWDARVKTLMEGGLSQADAETKAIDYTSAPGTSDHNTGLGLDIVSEDHPAKDAGFAETAAAQWLAEHAADYGFILRYPSDKTEATGMDYEPWHYRYVGSEQAHKIKESGLCLEEYLAQ